MGWDDVRVREFRPRDFTWELVGDDVPYRARLVELTQNHGILPALTVEYLGRPIGIHFLDKIANGEAEFWAHFLSPDSRGKGIGAISWFKACQVFFDSLPQIQTLLFRAPKGNAYAGRLLKKLPLKFQNSDPFADIYVITRAEFTRLRGDSSSADEMDDELED